MGIRTLLAQFLLPLVDVRVQLVPVLPDRELLVVVDGDLDFLRAVGLVVRVVELGHVLVFQRLFRSQPLVRVEHQQLLN